MNTVSTLEQHTVQDASAKLAVIMRRFEAAKKKAVKTALLKNMPAL